MSNAAASAEPAPETLDEKIARLKRELADAELDKAGDALGDVVGEFFELIPEWRVGTGPLPTVEELEAATRFATEAWERFTSWRTERAAEAEKRPYLALPVVPRAALPSGRSPAGAGSVYAAGRGFKWRLSRDGKLIASRTWPSREEAEIELAKALADPAFVPAPRDRTRLAGTGKHHCSKCGSADHRAPTCPGGEGVAPQAKETARPAIAAGAAPEETPPEQALSAIEPPPPDNGPAMTAVEVEALIREHAGLVPFHARKVREEVSARIDFDDLVGYGNRGLVEAAQRFDPARGVAFPTFAYRRIRGAMLDGLRTMGWYSRADYARYRAAEEAAEAGASIDGSAAPVYVVALEAAAAVSDGRTATDDVVDASRATAAIREAIADLPEMERELMERHFVRGENQDTAAAALGISKSWACRVIQRAEGVIRARLTEDRLLPSDPPAPADEDSQRAVATTGAMFVHPGRGWLPADAEGRARHVLCNGTGKVTANREKRDCHPCQGKGFVVCARRDPEGERRSA